MTTGVQVPIEVADTILRSRMPGVGPLPNSTSAPVGPAIAGSQMGAAIPNCGAGSSQSIEIATLAAGLKCDPDLIFEYVYNNIEYEPLFGSNKGALGTLLDQRGSDIDQAQLFVALLSAAGFTPSQINYQYGYIRLTAALATTS